MMSKEPTKIDRVEQMTKIQEEAKSLFKQKNADYGDAFADYGTVGVLVRMGDKIRRLQSISNKGINLVKDESLRDTLIDLHNYAAMAIMLLDEKNKSNIIPSEKFTLNLFECLIILKIDSLVRSFKGLVLMSKGSKIFFPLKIPEIILIYL